jgi:hypothetical protein
MSIYKERWVGSCNAVKCGRNGGEVGDVSEGSRVECVCVCV